MEEHICMGIGFNRQLALEYTTLRSTIFLQFLITNYHIPIYTDILHDDVAVLQD